MQVRDRVVRLERVPANELIANHRNWRTHGEEQKRVLDALMQAIGFAGSCLARQGASGELILLDGHARVERAGECMIPVLVTDLSESEGDILLASFDSIAKMAGTDKEQLDCLMRRVQFADEDIAGMITALGEREGLFDEDEEPTESEPSVPAAPAEPVTQPGDIWQLGRHRLMCGDSTDTAQVRKLLDGELADLWITDPPYNVDYVGKTKDALTIDNDSMEDETFRLFLANCYRAAFDNMRDGAAFYIWHAGVEGFNFRMALRDIGETEEQTLIWHKNVMVMGRQDYQWKHEPCLYGWKGSTAPHWTPAERPSSVLKFDRPSRSSEHPTMKPIPLFEYQIGISTPPQGIILDSFTGSGTTILAAERLGRTAYAMELSPAFCDVIISRWQQESGDEAVRHEAH